MRGMNSMRWIFVVLCGSAIGCSPEPWPVVIPAPAAPDVTGGPRVASADATTLAPLPRLTLSADAVAALEPLLTDYDAVYLALMSDSLNGVATRTAAITKTARLARSQVKDATVAALLVEIEARARKLGEGDLDATRLTFGDLSQSLVALLSGVEPLRRGRHVFECPMAKGYQKWIQVEPGLKNPYFGASMLTCGDESQWAP